MTRGGMKHYAEQCSVGCNLTVVGVAVVVLIVVVTVVVVIVPTVVAVFGFKRSSTQECFNWVATNPEAPILLKRAVLSVRMISANSSERSNFLDELGIE